MLGVTVPRPQEPNALSPLLLGLPYQRYLCLVALESSDLPFKRLCTLVLSLFLGS